MIVVCLIEGYSEVWITFSKSLYKMPTLHLYVANYGPANGISFGDIKKAFETFNFILNV